MLFGLHQKLKIADQKNQRLLLQREDFPVIEKNKPYQLELTPDLHSLCYEVDIYQVQSPIRVTIEYVKVNRKASNLEVFIST